MPSFPLSGPATLCRHGMTAVRSLRGTPGYAAIALLTLALGIGVNTAIFTLIDTVLFRSGPFPHAERLVQVMATTRQGELREFAEVEQREIRSQASLFESFASVGRVTYAVAEPGRAAERLNAIIASAEMFATFGVQPLLGRPFTAEETQQGKNQVVLLSHGLWRQRYGGSPDVLGRTLRLDGEVVTNLVLRGPAPAALAESLRRAVAEVDPDLAVEDVGTVRQFIEQQQRNLLLVGQTLGGFALLGLVLASVGLYSVISHTVAQRSGEFGIRLALGAQPAGLLALVLGHGIRLTVAGVVLGLAGAYGLGRFLDALLPRLGGADPVALLGVSAILFAVALIACWLPARRATKVDPMVILRSE